MMNISDLSSLNDATDYVETTVSQLCDIIHKSCSDSNVKLARRNRKKPKRWWTADCTAARERTKLWFTIWKECNRPCSGHVYNCYKEAKYNFRQICRKSVNKERKRIFEEI